MEFRGLRRLRSTRGPSAPTHDRDRAGTPADEYDMPAEVDAAFRTLRRVALGYGLVFVVVVGAVPGLTVAVDWWSDGRLIGGMSPSFVMAAVGLYLFFFVLGLAAASLSTAVEARMLGGPDRTVTEREGPPL